MNNLILQNFLVFQERNKDQPDTINSKVFNVPRLKSRPALSYREHDLILADHFDDISFLAKVISEKLKHLNYFVFNDKICSVEDGVLKQHDKELALSVFCDVVVFAKKHVAKKTSTANYVKQYSLEDRESFIAFDPENQTYYERTTPAIVACINPVWHKVKTLLPSIDKIHYKPYFNASGEVIDVFGIHSASFGIIPPESKKKSITIDLIPSVINKYFVKGIFRNVNIDEDCGAGMAGVVAAALGCIAWDLDFDGRKPLLYIGSKDRGSGKSVLSKIFSKLTGAVNSYASMSLVKDTQFSREFLSFMRQGYSYLELANSDISLGSCDKLANYITSGEVGGKRTGESDGEMIKSNAIVSITAANQMIEGEDFERRTLVINLKKFHFDKAIKVPSDEEVEEARLWGMACIEAIWKHREKNLENKVLFKDFKDWSYVCLDIALMCGLEDKVTKDNNLDDIVIKEDKRENLVEVFDKLREWSGGRVFLARDLIKELFEKDKDGVRLFGNDFIQDLRICCGINDLARGHISTVAIGRMLNLYGKDYGLSVLRKWHRGVTNAYQFSPIEINGDCPDIVLSQDTSTDISSFETIKHTPKKHARYTEEEIKRVSENIMLSNYIGRDVKLTPVTAKETRGFCPFHVERTPSFDVNDKKGVYLCRGCGETGNIFTWLEKMKGLKFGEAMDYLGGSKTEEISNVSVVKKTIEIKEDNKDDKYFSKIINDSIYDYDVLKKYFIDNRLRGELVELPKSFRYHSNLNAIVCPIESLKDGNIIGCHRHYLDLQNDNSELLIDEKGKRVKKLLGGVKNGGIKLKDSLGADTVILTEGVETGLAVSVLLSSGCFGERFKTMWQFADVYSCVSSNNLKNIEVPERYDFVYIFADNDIAGMDAADALAKRDKRVIVVKPEKHGDDFLDELLTSK